MRGAVSAVLAAVLAATPCVAQPPVTEVTVEGLSLNGGEAPAPRVGMGAPMYSPEQTASFVCVAMANGRGVEEARRAHEATVAAREVRMNAANGGATRDQMADAERVRQEAIRQMTGTDNLAIGGLLSFVALLSRGDRPSTAARDGIAIDDVVTRRALENGRAVLIITGRVRNRDTERKEVIPITLQAVDANGFGLASQSNLLDREFLEPGEAATFTFRFKNPPQYTARVDVGFSSNFQTRNFRGCDFFDPAKLDTRQADVTTGREGVTPVPAPVVGEGAPYYTAKELAILFQRIRTDAQSAFTAAEERRQCPNEPPLNRHAWRALFIQADLANEAWVATNAAEETRRDAAMGPVPKEELEQAELQRQTAVRAYVAARPKPLAAMAPSAVRYPLENFTWKATGAPGSPVSTIRYSVDVRNPTDASGTIPGLLFTLKDRFGNVVAEILRGPQPQPMPANGSRMLTGTLNINAAVVSEVTVAYRADPPPAPLTRRQRGDPCAEP